MVRISGNDLGWKSGLVHLCRSDILQKSGRSIIIKQQETTVY